LLAFGGGVIGDLTGFVASTLLRGIRFVQLPTTLVAQVDAGIGGKTGVNHSKGKNLIGTFYQPKLVLIDVATLRTLPTRHVIGGLAEVVKYGVIADAKLFDELERQASALLDCPVELMEQIVGRSARIKADVVRKDEREAGLRRILNYGHSLGHALETVTGYRRYHHGEAIAIGMQFASFLAVRRGMADHTLFERQGALLASLQLPTRLPARLPRQRLLAAMTHDKKVQQGTLQMVLPTKLGQVAVQPVASQELRDALAEFAAL
jgi:3-dehydroquinate synthase